jgi:hypothetical protein
MFGREISETFSLCLHLVSHLVRKNAQFSKSKRHLIVIGSCVDRHFKSEFPRGSILIFYVG